MGRYVISSALIWGPTYLGPQPKNLKHKEKLKQKMAAFHFSCDFLRVVFKQHYSESLMAKLERRHSPRYNGI